MSNFQFKPLGLKEAFINEAFVICIRIFGIIFSLWTFVSLGNKMNVTLAFFISIMVLFFSFFFSIKYKARAVNSIIKHTNNTVNSISTFRYLKAVLWYLATKLVYVYLPMSFLTLVMIYLGKINFNVIAVIIIILSVIYILIMSIPLELNSLFRVLYCSEYRLYLDRSIIKEIYSKLSLSFILVYFFVLLSTKFGMLFESYITIDISAKVLLNCVIISTVIFLVKVYLKLCLYASANKVFENEKKLA